MNRFAFIGAFVLALALAGAAEAQYYTTYYAPATTVYYAPAPAPVTYYARPVSYNTYYAPPVSYSTYYAPAPVYVSRPVVYYRPMRPLIFPGRWYY